MYYVVIVVVECKDWMCKYIKNLKKYLPPPLPVDLGFEPGTGAMASKR